MTNQVAGTPKLSGYVRSLSKLMAIGAILLAVLGLSTSAWAQSLTTPVLPKSRITEAVDERKMVAMPASLHPITSTGVDEGAVDESMQLRRIKLLLKPSNEQAAALKQLAADQMDPHSVSFHQWITPEAYGAMFGVAQSDIDVINAWLKSQGLSVESVAKAGNVITFSGTAGQVQAAFRTSIHSYALNGEHHFANATGTEIPAALAPVVHGIVSLNDVPPAPLHHRLGKAERDAKTGLWKVTPDQGDVASPLFTSTFNGYLLPAVGPADFALIYNVQPLLNAGIDGTGQSIGIVGVGGLERDDVNSFRSIFGLSPAKVILDAAGAGGYNSTYEAEATLDVQWAGAVARGATIHYYGSDVATAGKVQDELTGLIDENMDPIISVSYGACEASLGSVGNRFYYTMYEQAAVQGISVFVAAGDAGSTSCNPTNGVIANDGLQVNGLASTPYNVAVGGTDFSGNYPHFGAYWNGTNDPVTLESALSYIPETPWNNSCGNTVLLPAVAGNLGTGADKTPEALCNDSKGIAANLDVISAGGGGPSSCFDGSATCASGGYPKPVWQTGVPNIPNDGVRDLPDVALFAGNGTWSSFYVYCDAASYAEICSQNNMAAAGGTSFGAPAMAGIMALIDQKTNSRQGNPNYILYSLAAKEYTNATTTAACNSSQVLVGNACLFYDITTGDNAVACKTGTPNCVTTIPSDYYGVLSGWNAGTAYDMASGLGSVNAYNLVNAWAAEVGASPTSTSSLTFSSLTPTYGSQLSFSIKVQGASGSTGVPTGDTALFEVNPGGYGALQNTVYSLTNGQAGGTLNGLTVGSYQFYARYAGDSAFSGSTSNTTTVTVGKASTQSTLTASRVAVPYGGNTTLTVALQTSGTGIAPTGTVAFTDTTSSLFLGQVQVSSITSPSGATLYQAVLPVTAGSLAAGSNTVTAVYSGDANYFSSTAPSIALTVQVPFSVVVKPGSLSVAATAGPVYTATVSVIPAGAYAPGASQMAFSCTNPPVGLSCTFGTPMVATDGSLSSILSIQLGSPIALHSAIQRVGPMGRGSRTGSESLEYAGLLGVAVMFLGSRRRWKTSLPILAGLVCLVPLVIGCAGGRGGSGPSGQSQSSATTTSLTSSATSPAWGAPVTFTANVASSASGTPTGSVTFFDGQTTLANVPLVSGVATLSTSALTVGQHSVTAEYGGDSTNRTSGSSAVKLDEVLSTSLSIRVSDALGNSGTASLPLTVQ